MILSATIAGPNMRLPAQVLGGNVAFSSSAPDPLPDGAFPFGTPFDARTLETAGSAGDGSFVTLAGQYWAGPEDNDNIGYQDGAGNQAKFYSPNGMCVGADGYLYVSEFGYEPSGQEHPPEMAAGHTIRRINRATGEVSTLAGLAGSFGHADGIGSAARFYSLVALFPTTTGILIAEYGDSTLPGNARIRHVTYGGIVTTVAFTGAYSNTDGPAAAASMVGPNGVTMDSQGNIYVCGYSQSDPFNGVVRKIANDSSRTVTTIATGLALPANCAMFDDDVLWVIGFTSGTLYRIDLGDGNAVTEVTTGLGMNANGIARGNGCLYYVLSGPPSPGPRVMKVTIPDAVVSAISGVEGQHDDPASNHHALSCVAFDGRYVYAGDHYGNRVTKMLPI